MNRIAALLALAAAPILAYAGPSTWRSSSAPLQATMNPQFAYVEQFASFKVDMPAFRTELSLLPNEAPAMAKQGETIYLPGPNGSPQRFRMMNSPIQSPAMEAQSGVKTFAAQGIDDPYATGRFDLGRNGFHGIVFSPQGDWVIEPAVRGDMENYVVYFRRDNFFPKDWTCKVVPSASNRLTGGIALRPGSNRKEYRLAIKGTVEYTAFYGGSPAAMNGAITSVNRVSGVYEKDHAIRLIIVSNVMYAAEPDPYTNNNGSTMLGQNQTACDAVPGNANYDIGHVFSTGGGGVAVLQSVGVTGSKARGVTGSGFPQGDGFDIDYVAHEMGHQYGANHCFNGTTSSCGGGNRSASHAYEPGSASTIMGYAGICGAENVQSNSDAYQHADSQAAIEAWRNNAGSGGTTINTGNNSPIVNAGLDYTIPASTPYRLTAVASDPDSDPLTYCWEQWNLGTASPPTSMANGPIVRSRNPSTSPTRWFPPQSNVINNTTDSWDLLPTVARNMSFRCTVRDNKAGGGNYEWDQVSLTVVAGAFAVTSPNTAVSWAGGSSQTVTWSVGGSGGTANVRILLSTDGGNSYFNNTATVLVASTANDGTETITIPNTATTSARIIVEGVNNIFYDMSNTNFTITAAALPPTITTISPTNANAGGSTFLLTVNGTNFVGTSTVRWNGLNRTTNFIGATQLTAIINASDIVTSGTAVVTVITPAVGTSNPVNFTINPVTSNVNPSSYSILAGTAFGGTLSSLFSSDNDKIVILCDELDANGTLQVLGTSPIAAVTRVQLIFETSATRADLSQFTELFNYQTSAFESGDFRSAPISDVSTTLTYTSNPIRFVNQTTREMRARIRWIPQTDIDSGDGWTQSTDQLRWTINN